MASTKDTSFDTEKSDKYLAFLEAQPDTQETLQHHLLSQLAELQLSQEETDLCTKIIGNLDGKGFNILAPVSLLKKKETPDFPSENHTLLETCLDIVQQMDPIGCATDSQLDSLLVQARIKVKEQGISQDLALFILEGRLSLIEGLKIPSIKSQLLHLAKNGVPVPQPINENTIEKAIQFIKTLDPIPGRQYGDDPGLYIYPDVIIKKLSVQEPSDEGGENKLLPTEHKDNFQDKASSLLISLTTGLFPQCTISQEFQKELKTTTDKKVAKVWHDCALCNGSGTIVYDTNPPLYGQTDYPKYCSTCQRTFMASLGHTHITCKQCHGRKGYYTESY